MGDPKQSGPRLAAELTAMMVLTSSANVPMLRIPPPLPVSVTLSVTVLLIKVMVSLLL